MTEKQEVFISVDIEAAGPIPPDFSMLSIGACRVDDIEGGGFYRELKPINDRFDPDALKVTGFDLEILRREGVEPDQAMAQFSTWISEITGSEGRPVFVGFNAPFDWSFVNYYFHHFLGANPFGIGALDVKALYMGATGCAWSETRSSMFPVANQAPEQRHNALGDARHQARLFRHVLSLRQP
ncbi:3'-5' exonuclease [Mesorhizobium sp. LNJC405B00]|uniref:3'-5' exonuclease n=1 Tax=Mesorhizobium sp. LNJC405B00 TaxID=1287281 RepID=UPI0003CF8FE0|nr:3'-5' exonuclease [Mesorhizobium sp. LNJC405B00]ESY01405.1 exonuclease [Mesorhizobium sp. LNJC405B00]